MTALTFTRRRQAPQSDLLVLVMCAEAFYCFGYAQEMAQTTLAGAIFWLRVEYIGIPWIPALWVLIGRRHFGLRGRAVLLSIIPVIVAIAEWINGMHGLYDRSMMLVPRGPFWVVEVHRGPIAWLNLAFLYGSLFYGRVLCLSRIRASSGLVRLQWFHLCISPRHERRAPIQEDGRFVARLGRLMARPWPPFCRTQAGITSLGSSILLSTLVVYHPEPVDSTITGAC